MEEVAARQHRPRLCDKLHVLTRSADTAVVDERVWPADQGSAEEQHGCRRQKPRGGQPAGQAPGGASSISSFSLLVTLALARLALP